MTAKVKTTAPTLAAKGAWGRERKPTDEDLRLMAPLLMAPRRMAALEVAMNVQESAMPVLPLTKEAADGGADGEPGVDRWLWRESTEAERMYLAYEFAQARWLVQRQKRERKISSETARRIEMQTEELRKNLLQLASLLNKTLAADDVIRSTTRWPTQILRFVDRIEAIVHDAEGKDHEKKTLSATAALHPIVVRSRLVLGLSWPQAEGLIAELAGVDVSVLRKKRPKKKAEEAQPKLCK